MVVRLRVLTSLDRILKIQPFAPTIVNRNTDMVRKAGKLQRLSAEMLTYLFAFVTWYAKVHICVVSKE